MRRTADTGSHRDRSGRDLVLVDQEPLRAGVAAECAEAQARLEKARAGWHHFERKDKPAFARWRAREFGALLSAARDVETEIGHCQALIHEVEMEMRLAFQDPYTAYQRVLFRRENPAAAAAAAEASARSDGGEVRRKLTEFEQETLFQEWVQRSLGTHPDKMDDEAYASSFEAFKAHMFQALPEEMGAEKPQVRSSARVRETEEEAEAGEARMDGRVKELYRRLVRRLHPDLRADGNATVSALWHEVQEAYAASDVARMEILLAMSDIESQRTDDQSLGMLQALRTELQRAFRALEKNLLEAQGEDAWDFARIGPRADLRLRVERQLKMELAARSARLDLLRRTIAEWARGPVRNRQVRVV